MAKKTTEELYSITRLAEYFELDRATMRKRLVSAGISPVVDQSKRKLFRLEDAESAIVAADAGDLSDAKLRKLRAEANLKELELKRETDELLPRREVEAYLQQLFTAIFQRIAVRFPRQIAGQCAKADNAAQITQILQTSLEKIFNDLRSDHTRFFSGDQKSNP